MVMESSLHRTEDGVELAMWTLAGARPEFLLVHGLASNARLWDGVARGLNGLGHGVVSLDQRGHGRSDKTNDGFDFATLAADLAGLISDKMAPPVIAVGQSFGGNLVMELAARHPELVSGVVCVDGGFVDLRGVWGEWEEARRALTPPPLEDLRSDTIVSNAADRFPGWPPEGIAAQLENLEVLPDGSVRRRLSLESHLRILRATWEQTPAEVAAQVAVPVLVLVADSGPPHHQVQVESFVRKIDRHRLVLMPGHHDLHAQQPDAVVDVIAKALREGFFE
jgi:pimeloyl-ACP methyl ester carboxylesterase